MSQKIVDDNKKWLMIKKRILDKTEGVIVGVRGNQGNSKLAAIASYHEYGSRKRKNRPPKRSFIGSTFDDNLTLYYRILLKICSQVLSLSTTKKQGLNRLGLLYQKDIRNKIRRGISPSLKPATKRRKKGKNTPLINTGQLLRSITYKAQ